MSGSPSRRAGEDFKEHRVTTADGLSLYVRDYTPTEPVTGWPVFCLHGLTRNARDFETVAPRIASLGRRTLAWDTRGRAKSDRDSDPARYNPAIYAQDALKVLDHFGIERAVFLGTSMGGMITMVASTMAPQRIAAAILNDIGPEIDPVGLGRIMAFTGKMGAVASWQEAASESKRIHGHAHPEGDEAFWLRFAKKTFKQNDAGAFEPDYDPAIARAFDAAPADAPPPDMTPLFQALAGAAPVCVVRGDLSDILPAATVPKMQAIDPDLHVINVPNTGHAPTLEEAAAWEGIIDFLAKVP